MELRRKKGATVALVAATLSLAASAAHADERDQALKMHTRLTGGLVPDKATVDEMAALIKEGKMIEAGLKAIDNEKQSGFYNNTMKTFVVTDTDEDGNPTRLNDYIATWIAVARDDIDARKLLYGNIIAKGDHTWDPKVYEEPYTIGNGGNQRTFFVPQFSPDSNKHYEEMERRGIDLKKHLVIRKQTDPEIDPTGKWVGHEDKYPAGMMTTRGWSGTFYNAGTNRIPLRFMLKNFFCEDIEAWHDTTIADDGVRRDPTRAPGGEPSLFVNKCKGCHAGMDPMTDAFAYLDWDDTTTQLKFTKPLPDTPFNQVKCATNPEVTLTPNSSYEDKLRCAVVTKYLNNKETAPEGRAVVSDDWVNKWIVGHNARAGWPSKYGELIKGSGPKQLGMMFANSDAFPKCMAKRALAQVCKIDDWENQVVVDKWSKLTRDFQAGGFKLKTLMAEAASMCLGN